MKQSFKQQTMKLSGMTESEYNKAYNRIKKQTALYNKTMNSNMSAAKLLYYDYRYKEKSITRRAVAQMSTHVNQTSLSRANVIAQSVFEEKWKGMLQKSPYGREVYEAFLRGEITLKQANDKLIEWANHVHEMRKDKDPLYNS